MTIDPNNGDFDKTAESYSTKIREALRDIVTEMIEQGIPYAEIYLILETASCLELYAQT
jgi:hypothetical protein